MRIWSHLLKKSLMENFIFFTEVLLFYFDSLKQAGHVEIQNQIAFKWQKSI